MGFMVTGRDHGARQGSWWPGCQCHTQHSVPDRGHGGLAVSVTQHSVPDRGHGGLAVSVTQRSVPDRGHGGLAISVTQHSVPDRGHGGLAVSVTHSAQCQTGVMVAWLSVSHSTQCQTGVMVAWLSVSHTALSARQGSWWPGYQCHTALSARQGSWWPGCQCHTQRSVPLLPACSGGHHRSWQRLWPGPLARRPPPAREIRASLPAPVTPLTSGWATIDQRSTSMSRRPPSAREILASGDVRLLALLWLPCQVSAWTGLPGVSIQ